jgi:hypothetical protein
LADSARLPNSDARRKAVVLHDLHHVATGYKTDWTGEAEISAREIASAAAVSVWLVHQPCRAWSWAGW